MSLHSCRTAKALLSAIVLVLLVVMAQPSYAIPAFARQYGTSCSTCHIDFPKLNDFGKAFKDAGFKFPKDDESMLKIPPVMLGAPANAEVWPKAIWPGTIPGHPTHWAALQQLSAVHAATATLSDSLPRGPLVRYSFRPPTLRPACSACSPPETSAATSPSGSTMTSASAVRTAPPD